MDKYVLDTSVFIEGARHYPPKIFPTIWDFFADHIINGDFIVIDWVYDEINRGTDQLIDFIEQFKTKGLIETTNVSFVMNKYREILMKLYSLNKYNENAFRNYCENADGHVVAFASLYGYKVVTEEKRNDSQTGNIKMPNACIIGNVMSLSTTQLFIELGLKI